MSKKAAPRDMSFQDYLIESLRDPAEAATYLEAAMEEDDPATFLLALRQVTLHVPRRGCSTVQQVPAVSSLRASPQV